MSEVRYTVQLPWIGPQLGDLVASGTEKWLTLGGATDPALGSALMAAFVPVIEDADRFAAADGTGTRRDVEDVGWVQACESSGAARRFSVEVPASRWTDKIKGVLVVLVYNQSGTLSQPSFPETYPGQLEFYGAGKGIVPAKPTPIASLPGAMKEETRRRLNELLKAQTSKRLRKGLTRLP